MYLRGAPTGERGLAPWGSAAAAGRDCDCGLGEGPRGALKVGQRRARDTAGKLRGTGARAAVCLQGAGGLVPPWAGGERTAR